HLRTIVLPASDEEARLGPDLFAAKMLHTLRDPELTSDRIAAHAEREYKAVRAEMVRIARAIAPDWLGDEPVPDADDAVVRAVLDRIALEHPRRDALLDFCIAEVGTIESFVRRHDLITLTDEPLVIEWTPLFLRASS